MTTTKSTKTAAKKSTSKTAATRALREKKATPKASKSKSAPTLPSLLPPASERAADALKRYPKKADAMEYLAANGDAQALAVLNPPRKSKKATKASTEVEASAAMVALHAQLDRSDAKSAAKKSAPVKEPKPAALPSLRAIYNAAMKANVDRKALAAELGVELKSKATNRDVARAIAKAVVASGKLPSALSGAVKAKRAKSEGPRKRSTKNTIILDMLVKGATKESIVKALVKAVPDSDPKRLRGHVNSVCWDLSHGRIKGFVGLNEEAGVFKTSAA